MMVESVRANTSLPEPGPPCTTNSIVRVGLNCCAETGTTAATSNAPLNTWRDSDREPASVEVSNLVFTVPESHAGPLYDWFEEFAINGKNSQEYEKTGYIEYMSPNMRETYFRLNLDNIGIFKLTADKLEAGSEVIRRVKAEMYVERMSFDYESGKAFG